MNLPFPANHLREKQPINFSPLNDTKVTWIDTPAALESLAQKLDQVEEIAIDMEAHSYRTFQGFTCLMQISTRKEDFLVDTLALRNNMSILNTSFTNPKILKVLHGA